MIVRIRMLAILSSWVLLSACGAVAGELRPATRHEPPQRGPSVATGVRKNAGADTLDVRPSSNDGETHLRVVSARAREAAKALPYEGRAQSCKGTTLVHIVAPGETLWRISHRHGRSPADVARINGIKDVTHIIAGQRITIPCSVPAEADSKVPRPSPGKPRLPRPTEAVKASVADRERDLGNRKHELLEQTTDPELLKDELLSSGPDQLPQEEQPTGSATFDWPLNGVILSLFGVRHGRMHSGLDLGAPAGTEIHAARSGTVLYAGDGFRGYGNVVFVGHVDGFVTIYAHNQKNFVRQSDRVEAGDAIALVGQSGNATTPHVHFEIRRGEQPVDPLQFLPGQTPPASGESARSSSEPSVAQTAR